MLVVPEINILITIYLPSEKFITFEVLEFFQEYIPIFLVLSHKILNIIILELSYF